jgi:hypothetical protein
MEYNAMYRERMEYEERERKLAEERKQAGIKRVSGVFLSYVNSCFLISAFVLSP